MSSQTRTFEPSEAFKAQLQKRIDDNLNQLLLDAKKSYDDKLSSLPSLSLPPHSSSNPRRPLSPSPMDAANDDAGASDLLYRRKLYYDYLQSVQELKNFARDEYKNAIERERQEMEWCVEAQASVAQAQGLRMVALEEGYGYHGEGEGFKVDEREKQEQFEMIEAFHEEMKRAEAKARLIEQSSDEEYSSSDEEEEDYGNISYRPHPVLVELSEIEEVSEVEDDDSEFSGPGTPIVHPQPLDASLKAHAEELSRLLSATPSPPASPSLSAPSPLPGTPSPPDTPPSLTASASASDCELDTDEGETAPSSVASSIIFNPKDDVTGGLIFTPHRSVIDEEIRVRAERHAKQQEAFAQRAEEIRKKKEEDKKASRVNEMLVSLVSDSKDEPQDQSKALVVVDKTKGKGKLPATPFNSPAISRSNTTTTVARYGAAPPGSQYYRAQTPSVSLALAASRALATPAPKAAAPTTPSKPLKQKTSVALFSSPSYAQQPGYKAVPRTFVNPTGFSVSPEDVLRILSSHEAQWQKLLSSSPSSAISSSTNGGGALKWTDFPWPVLSFTPPKSSGELSKDGVAAYVYSSLEASSLAEYDDYNGLGDPLLSHSSPSSRASSRAASPFNNENPRERHRRREKLEALVGRWSGYGFERVLYRVGVSGGERERVRYGAGLVCRWVREMGDDLGW